MGQQQLDQNYFVTPLSLNHWTVLANVSEATSAKDESHQGEATQAASVEDQADEAVQALEEGRVWGGQAGRGFWQWLGFWLWDEWMGAS